MEPQPPTNFWLLKTCLAKTDIVILHVILASLALFLRATFSRWTWVSQYQNVYSLDFIGAKDDGGGGNNWSYKMCKAPVKSPSPMHQHPDFYRWDALPIPKSTVSENWRKIHNFTYITQCTINCQLSISPHKNSLPAGWRGGKSYLTDWMGLLNLPLHIILINDIFKSTETEPSTDVALLELVV